VHRAVLGHATVSQGNERGAPSDAVRHPSDPFDVDRHLIADLEPGHGIRTQTDTLLGDAAVSAGA
jgi:hypothetical protein